MPGLDDMFTSVLYSGMYTYLRPYGLCVLIIVSAYRGKQCTKLPTVRIAAEHLIIGARRSEGGAVAEPREPVDRAPDRAHGDLSDLSSREVLSVARAPALLHERGHRLAHALTNARGRP